MQYEDATDNIQSLREKLELERAARLEWLRSAAATCAHSCAAANGNAQVGCPECSSRYQSHAGCRASYQREERSCHTSGDCVSHRDPGAWALAERNLSWALMTEESCSMQVAEQNGHGGGEDSHSIALSLPYTQRAQRELRVSKQQVRPPFQRLLICLQTPQLIQ